MRKWNAFTIDTSKLLCKDEKSIRENFYHYEREAELANGWTSGYASDVG
jgi:hypothetical protein